MIADRAGIFVDTVFADKNKYAGLYIIVATVILYSRFIAITMDIL